MRTHLLALLAAALPALAAVDGTVTNRTSNLPQQGATVALYKLGQNGMEAAGQAKTDALGRFRIEQDVQGPHLLQSVFDGVTYNHMLPPGTPTAGLNLEVFAASRKQPPAVKIAQHMLLLEPSEGQLAITESYIFNNTGNLTWNDPNGGTLKFYLPPAAKGAVQVNATAPNGLPVRRAAENTGRGDVWKLDFAIKPGETRIDLAYAVPYKGGPYQGRLVMKDEATRVVAPKGVTLKGDNLAPLAPEPRTQASIYDLKGPEYSFEIEGTGSLRAAQGGQQPGQQDEGGEQQDSGGPSIEQILPRVNSNVPLILGIAFGILALGFALLYRARETPAAAPAKEANERRRR
jgi:hypothetical protein